MAELEELQRYRLLASPAGDGAPRRCWCCSVSLSSSSQDRSEITGLVAWPPSLNNVEDGGLGNGEVEVTAEEADPAGGDGRVEDAQAAISSHFEERGSPSPYRGW